MLKSNFIDNFKYYGEALYFIEQKAPHKLSDLRQCHEANHVEAATWLVEELMKNVDNCARQEKIKVLVRDPKKGLVGILGIPRVPKKGLVGSLGIPGVPKQGLGREPMDPWGSKEGIGREPRDP